MCRSFRIRYYYLGILRSFRENILHSTHRFKIRKGTFVQLVHDNIMIKIIIIFLLFINIIIVVIMCSDSASTAIIAIQLTV